MSVNGPYLGLPAPASIGGAPEERATTSLARLRNTPERHRQHPEVPARARLQPFGSDHDLERTSHLRSAAREFGYEAGQQLAAVALLLATGALWVAGSADGNHLALEEDIRYSERC